MAAVKKQVPYLIFLRGIESIDKLKQNPLHLLWLYFQAAKYCCVFPIEFKWNGTKYIIQKWAKNRMIFCFLITFSCLFTETTRFCSYLRFSKPTEVNPVSYFEVARFLASAVYPITTFTTIWWKTKSLERVLDLLQKSSPHGLANHYSHYISKKRTLLMIAWFIAINCFTFSLFIKETLLGQLGTNFHLVLLRWREIFYKQFFFDIIIPNANECLKNTIGILGICMMFLSILAYNFIDWLPHVFTSVLHIEVNDCIEMMKKNLQEQRKIPTEKVEHVLKRYQLTLKLSQAINCVLGIAVFSFSLTWIPYFIFVFLELLNPPTITSFLRQVYRLGVYFGFMFKAALINNKCNDVEDWLSNPEVNSKLTNQQMQILLHEASSRKIGISGGRWFIISNSFVGSVVMSFLTFSIIILQFKSTNLTMLAGVNNGNQLGCVSNNVVNGTATT